VSAGSSQPLAGILVVDLTRHLPGPYATRMLANLGARVVKVEEPTKGDPVRLAPPFSGGRSVLATALLSGLESVALDIRKPGGRAVLDALVAAADVLVESFRPGTLARLWQSPEELERRFPRLVGCSISGWGGNGPAAGRAGHDLSYLAAAGALAATGSMPNLPSADLLGAWSAVAAISAALLARERGGRGTWIDASIFDAAVAGNLTNLGLEVAAESERPARGILTGALPCYRLYRSADGQQLAVALLERVFWNRFCRALERRDLVGLQYRTTAAAHRAVAELFASRPADEWQRLFVELDLPAEVVVDPAAALAGEQARARALEDPARGGVSFPARLGGIRPAAGTSFPRLGEHTKRVVEEFCSDLPRGRRRRLLSGIGAPRSVARTMRRWALARLHGGVG
jgi:crotonobetainyl-CoA:carnitine CoA-transferase CaiB-like acyl-CoA transferase